jgi:hypothetical protein
MPFTQVLRTVMLGLLSAVLAGVVSLILAYFVGVVVVALSVRELLPTLLTAGTVLPLMLIFVGIPVTIVLAVMIGGLLGLGATVRSKPPGLLIGALLGVVLGLFVLSLVLPAILPPNGNDFSSIVSRPYLSASYGFAMGLVSGLLQRWLDRRN